MHTSRLRSSLWLTLLLAGCGGAAPRAEAPRASIAVDLPDAHAQVEAGRAHLARIDEVVRAEVLPAAQACYEQARSDDPSLAGRLCIAFVVGPSGVARDDGACGEDGPIAALRPCVLAAVTAARFPSHAGGGETRVERYIELPHTE